MLHDDDLIVAYGVNHTTSGKSVYSNVTCYGATAYNGVGGIVSVPSTANAPSRISYRDTAGDFLSGLSATEQNQVYAYKFNRAGGTHTFAIPYNTGDYTGINSGDSVFMGFRSYVDTLTTVGPYPGDGVRDGTYYGSEGPASSEVYFDQVLLFTNTERAGSVADFSPWQLLGLGALFVCGGIYIERRRRRKE